MQIKFSWRKNKFSTDDLYRSPRKACDLKCFTCRKMQNILFPCAFYSTSKLFEQISTWNLNGIPTNTNKKINEYYSKKYFIQFYKPESYPEKIMQTKIKI